MADTDSPSPPSVRRWFHSTQTLVVIIIFSVGALAFGTVGVKLNRARRERQFAEYIVGNGGRVEFETLAYSASPTWWQERWNEWFPPHVTVLEYPKVRRQKSGNGTTTTSGRSVTIPGTEEPLTTPPDLPPLLDLPALHELSVAGTDVADLSPLSGLTNLDTLDIGGTQVRDLAPLKSLHHLRTLFADGAKVTDLSSLSDINGLESLAGC